MSKGRKIAIALVAVIAAATAGMFAFDRFTLGRTYARYEGPAVSMLPVYGDYRADYPRTDEQFELDGYTLRGHVYGADNERGLIIFRHGIFSQHQDYLPFITAAVDAGWRVFAYDAIGCGESDGDSTLGMSQSPLDVAAAVDFVRESGLAGEGPLVLWGHSWGGYGVAAALALRPDVDGCITMSGYDTPMKILDYSAESSFGVLGALQHPLIWLSTAIDFGQNANIGASDAIAASGVPTLVIHGTEDAVVPYEGVSILDALEGHQREMDAGANGGAGGGGSSGAGGSGAGGNAGGGSAGGGAGGSSSGADGGGSSAGASGAHDGEDSNAGSAGGGAYDGGSNAGASGAHDGEDSNADVGDGESGDADDGGTSASGGNRDGAGAGAAITLLTRSDPGRDGHNDYFYSPESQQLFNEHQARLAEILGEDPDGTAIAAAQAYRDDVDVRAANTPDPALMADILAFLDALPS